MSYQNVMSIPIKTFWYMSGSIRRLMAEKDLRALSVSMASQSGEGAKECQERLVLEMGVIVKSPIGVNLERDEDGFLELKALAASM